MTTFRPILRTVSMLSLLGALSAGCGSPQQFTAGRLPYGAGQAAAVRDPFLAQPEAGGTNAVAASHPPAGGYNPAAGGHGPAPTAPPAQAGQAPQSLAQSTPYDPTTNLRHYNRRPSGGDQMAAAGSQPPGGTSPAASGQTPRPTGNAYQTAYLQQPPTSNPFAVPPAGVQPVGGQPASMQTQTSPTASPSTGAIQQMSYQMPARVRDPNPFAEVEGQSAGTAATQQWTPQINPAGGSDAWQPQATSTAASEAFLPPER